MSLPNTDQLDGMLKVCQVNSTFSARLLFYFYNKSLFNFEMKIIDVEANMFYKYWLLIYLGVKSTSWTL